MADKPITKSSRSKWPEHDEGVVLGGVLGLVLGGVLGGVLA